MHAVEHMLVEKNYSKCPLKKRPVNYQFEAKQTTVTGTTTTKAAGEELINVSDCCQDEGVDVDDEQIELDHDEELEDDEDYVDCVNVEADPKQLILTIIIISSIFIMRPIYPFTPCAA